DASAASDVRDRLMRPGVEITPRKQWPTGLGSLGITLSGRISDGPGPGRVIGRLTDLGWGARLRQLLDGPDGEATDDVVQAAIAVLKAWDWQQRPVSVLALDSATRPLLIRSLAARLAQVGRLTDLGVLEYRSEYRPVTAANSAYRVAGLRDAWLPPVDVGSGPVLLVDDLTDTGWTLTMAARVVRSAGADAVLPFALAAVR
ncbi:MAG: recombinase RecQ, partial [Mycobacterium sp.]|nr:recombinase RecQ [Mycobacterium sp.]